MLVANITAATTVIPAKAGTQSSRWGQQGLPISHDITNLKACFGSRLRWKCDEGPDARADLFQEIA